MPSYPNLDELDKLWPEEGYAVIVEDEYKPPDSDDFVNMANQFDSPDFELPTQKEGYSYWVHDADGNSYSREEWSIYQSKYALTAAIKKVQDEHSVDEMLQQKREKGKRWWKRDDAIWFEIVLSLATQGGSYGSQLVLDEDNQIDEHKYGSVAFRTIAQVNPEHRYAYLEARLYGNVPRQSITAEAIERNFERVKEMDGPEEMEGPKKAKVQFESKDGPEAKMEFLEQFHRIGPKYKRNIPMDLYHPEFRDFIAVDSRIKKILKETGYPLEEREYQEHEEFLRSVAAELDMEPWALDRTLYNFEEEVCDCLQEGGP